VDILGIIITALLVLICLALIGLILIQRGKGGGLAGVFGGGSVEQAFGTHAATMAQKATAVLGILFLVLTVALCVLRSGRGRAIGPAGAPATGGPAQSEPGIPAMPETSNETPAAPAPATEGPQS
jgi:preprotein translocase subunit SecG